MNEFRRTREIALKLVDDLTAISRSVEIMMMRARPEQRISKLRKSSIGRRNRWRSCEIASRICTNWDGDIHNAAKTGAYKTLKIRSTAVFTGFRVNHRPAPDTSSKTGLKIFLKIFALQTA